MPRHINDHVPTGTSVAISADHLEEMFGPIRDAAQMVLDAPRESAPAPVAAPAVLSSEQFAELKELLAPGHELASLMLADYKAQREAALVDHSEAKASETKGATKPSED